MIGVINRLQVVLFTTMMQYWIERERREEAEKQADYYADLLLKVYATNEVLMQAINSPTQPNEGERYG